MDKLLILAAVVGYAYAAVGTLSPYEDARILKEYLQLCGSGAVPESGTLMNFDGVNSVIYCKQDETPRQQEFHHEAVLKLPESPQQVLFVRQPDMTFKHNLLITGNVKATKTNIYVVPAKVDSTLDLKVDPVTEPPITPVVHFLNREDNNGGRGGATRERLVGAASGESTNILGGLGSDLNSPRVRISGNSQRFERNEQDYYDYSEDDDEDVEDRIAATVGIQKRKADSKPQKRETREDVTHVLRVSGGGRQGKTRLYVIRVRP